MAKAKPAATVAQQWPADAVVRRKVGELIPYARNARTHSAAQVAQIAASIREFGFTNPVLIAPDGTIIAGHGRVLAAQKLKLDDVPTMTATGWTKTQIRLYVIADNKLAMNAGWDEELLSVELQELLAEGADLDLSGFANDELDKLLERGGEAFDPDLEGAPPDNLAGSKYAVIVECTDEAHQEHVFNQLAGLGMKAKVVSV